MYWLYLLVVTVLVFFLQMLVPGLTETLWFNPAHALSQPWGFFTSMFLHGGFEHLFFNMFALLIFGPILESRIGSNRFLGLYLVSGVLGSVGYLVTGGVEPALGASGAIFGVLGALVALEPNMMVFVSFIPMPMWLAGIFWFFTETVYGIAGSTSIANFAHVAGLVVGYFYARHLKPSLMMYGGDRL